MRQEVIDCRIEVTARRADSEPRVFTEIDARYIVSGHDLREDRVAEAVRLSAEKYCSASAMVALSAELSYDYALVNLPE